MTQENKKSLRAFGLWESRITPDLMAASISPERSPMGFGRGDTGLARGAFRTGCVDGTALLVRHRMRFRAS
jgi:hypothetical protein